MRLATMLFVSVIFLALTTIPSVASQTVTTITSILTTTGIFTSSSYSTLVAGRTTLTQTSGSAIASTINTLSVFGPLHCSWDYWNITVNAGTSEITGTIGPSSAGEAFYILTPQQYNDFQTANHDCSGYQGGEVEVTSLTSAYSLDWPNPPAGTYYVLFYDGTGGSTFPITTPFSLIATSVEEETSTIYSVSATQVTVPTTETVTSLQVSQMTSGPFTSIPGFPLESLVVGLLLGFAILLLRRPRKP